jgi:hypothetical protein
MGRPENFFMTLARLLLFGICCAAWTPSLWSTGLLQSAQEPSEGKATDTKQEENTLPQGPASSNPSSSKASPQATVQRKASKKTRHQKKTAAGCATALEPTPGTTVASPNTSPGNSDEGQSPANQPVTKCPPPKIIVRQGGTSEPAIQLAGGPKQSPEARASADPMLEATEANLKKLENRQLTDTEKGVVTQIRQFLEQSKTAVAAGDVERARTLAWKAQTLSEDLVNPPK